MTYPVLVAKIRSLRNIVLYIVYVWRMLILLKVFLYFH